MTNQILVIDDDPDIASLIELMLASIEVSTIQACDGQEGLRLAYQHQPDLVILDLMLPGMDGFEVCRRLREISHMPIVIVSAKTLDADIKKGFCAGADDFVKKPFSRDELLTRIQYLLRREKAHQGINQGQQDLVFDDGSLRMQYADHRAFYQGQELPLSGIEYRLLEYMTKNPNHVLSPRKLLKEVWGDAYSQDKSLLCYYIHTLRQKLDQGDGQHKYIQTQWGQGYWFIPQRQAEAVQAPIPSTGAPAHQPLPRQKARWLIPVTGLIILLSLIFLPRDISFAVPGLGSDAATLIEAHVSAEGVTVEGMPGLAGEICVRNTGDHSTENLAIVNSIQIHGKSKFKYYAATVETSKHPSIQPGESHCYPFELVFERYEDQSVTIQTITSITVTNHLARMPGSRHCPITELCPHGPEITTHFSLSS